MQLLPLLGLLAVSLLTTSAQKLCQTSNCSVGACISDTQSCVTFQVLLLKSDPTKDTSLIEMAVNSTCSGMSLVWVAFGLNPGSNASNAAAMSTSWEVSFPNGTTQNSSWLNFTKQGQVSSTSTVFSFTIGNYYPLYLWNLQAAVSSESGTIIYTYEGAEFWFCPCLDCDGGLNVRTIQQCTIDYPLSTSTGKPGVAFDESFVLNSFVVSESAIDMYYQDEWPLSLGVEFYKNENQTITSQNFTISETPSCIDYPKVGFLDWDPYSLTGNVDTATCPDGSLCGRPVPPTLFITDITENPNPPYLGDWQYNGTPWTPDRVCGVWQGLTRTKINSTVIIDNPALGTGPGPGPGPGPGARSPPGPGPGPGPGPAPPGAANFTQNINNDNVLDLGPAGLITLPYTKGYHGNYGAQIRWYLRSFNLNESHSYRFQFLVHDGDQNQDGGDVGEGCAFITSGRSCPAGYTGSNCQQCEFDPSPGSGWYTWFCNQTGNDTFTLIKIPTILTKSPPLNESGFIPSTPSGGSVVRNGYYVNCDCTPTNIQPKPPGLTAAQKAGLAVGVIGGAAVVGGVAAATGAAGFLAMRALNHAPPPDVLPDGLGQLAQNPASDNALFHDPSGMVNNPLSV